ncbi:MAG: LPS export ABC transporter permease LptF [Gammaproteobacteria bacterium]
MAKASQRGTVTGIIDRYVIREVLRTAGGVTLVLLLILVGNQFTRVLARAAADRLPKEHVFQLMGLTSLEYLTVLLPLALFFSVILALGRMYQHSEMDALGACGIGPLRLYRPLGWVGLIVAALAAWLAFQIGPWVNHRIHLLKLEAQRQMQVAPVEPGRFRSTADGNLVFYARAADPDGLLHDVFIQLRSGEMLEVAVAESGRQKVSSDGSRREIVLYQGRRFVGVPGTLDFILIDFEEHGIPILLPPLVVNPENREMRPTRELVGTGSPRDSAELHWRIAAPVSLLMLMVVAVPLARSSHRDSRFARLGLGIMVYLIYSNLLGVGRSLLERGAVPDWLGIWWVHLLPLLLALGMLASQHRAWAWRRSGAAT